MPEIPYELLRCADGRQRVIECARKANGKCEWDVRTACTGNKVAYVVGDRQVEQATHAQTFVAVTITGQLSRVEVRSKLDYFLHLASENQSLVIFLFIVLSHSESTLFRAEFNAARRETLEPLQALYNGTIEELALAMKGFVSGVYFYSYDQQEILSRELPFDNNSTFVSSLWAKDKKKAMISHIGQWDGLARAVGVIQRAEAELRRQFDFVVKVRDDDFFVLPFRLSLLLHHIQSDSADLIFNNGDLFSSGCGAFGGVNDHLFLVRRRALESSYGIGAMKAFFDGVVGDVEKNPFCHNPEFLLLKALEGRGFHHAALSPCDLPVVTVRRGWDEKGTSAQHLCLDRILFEALVQKNCMKDTFFPIAYACKERFGFLRYSDLQRNNFSLCRIADRAVLGISNTSADRYERSQFALEDDTSMEIAYH